MPDDLPLFANESLLLASDLYFMIPHFPELCTHGSLPLHRSLRATVEMDLEAAESRTSGPKEKKASDAEDAVRTGLKGKGGTGRQRPKAGQCLFVRADAKQGPSPTALCLCFLLIVPVRVQDDAAPFCFRTNDMAPTRLVLCQSSL